MNHVAGITDTGPMRTVKASVAPPDLDALPGEGIMMRRSFGFLDLSGFTSYTERHGAAGSAQVLRQFRDTVREVCSRRGVRVAKWLGDGVMIIGVEPAPVVCAAVEMVLRTDGIELGVRAGVATGKVMLFEGDDHIGPAVNLASRLCDAAGQGRVLADDSSIVGLPEWIHVRPSQPLRVRGIGRIDGIHVLSVADIALTDTPSV